MWIVSGVWLALAQSAPSLQIGAVNELPSPLWIFGYGSLIWRPDFPFVEQRPALIDGYERRFWQGSPDHRGTPESPGRVVTLIPIPSARCAGVAYRIADELVAPVIAHLDHREKGGYERHVVTLELAPSPTSRLDSAKLESIRGLIYVAVEGNPSFLGDAPLENIAQTVRTSRGPSGSNHEYVVRLAEALRAMGAPDPHVESLVSMLHG
ncbi:MAG: gamma-glutamylcyclotransferase [Polyangiaceae bacterium]